MLAHELAILSVEISKNLLVSKDKVCFESPETIVVHEAQYLQCIEDLLTQGLARFGLKIEFWDHLNSERFGVRNVASLRPGAREVQQ